MVPSSETTWNFGNFHDWNVNCSSPVHPRNELDPLMLHNWDPVFSYCFQESMKKCKEPKNLRLVQLFVWIGFLFLIWFCFRSDKVDNFQVSISREKLLPLFFGSLFACHCVFFSGRNSYIMLFPSDKVLCTISFRYSSTADGWNTFLREAFFFLNSRSHMAES